MLYPPVKRLHYDVLVIVLFMVYQPARYDWIASADIRTVLCLVCPTWATTIYSTPEFWQSLPLTLATCPRYARFHLDKSLNMPLSVLLHLRPFTVAQRRLGFKTDLTMSPTPAFMATILPIILPVFGRVQRLTVICDTHHIWRSVMARLATKPASGLVRLAVTFPPNHLLALPAPMALSPAPAGFCSISRLTEMRISGTACVWTTPSTYQNLTALRLLNLRRAAALQWPVLSMMLQAASGLRLLELSQVQLIGGANIPPLQLNHLTDLYITYTEHTCLAPLAALSVPNLHTFRLHALSDVVQPFLASFAQLLAQVRNLELYLMYLEDADVSAVLQAMPQLERLDIAQSRPRLFDICLSLLQTGAVNLPRLTDLRIGCSPTAEAVDSFLFSSDPGRPRLLCAMSKAAGMAQQYYLVNDGVAIRAVAMAVDGERIEDEWAVFEHRR
ncbi:hypothetical protein B0H13DRAFT_2335494 [Mycena leptocephala]|nr:hypothetical protein B0H13DRAFT_2335494 [Mycena leptocephala]